MLFSVFLEGRPFSDMTQPQNTRTRESMAETRRLGTSHATIPGVSPEDAVRALSHLAARAGVEVRIERFELTIVGKGGLCRIGGQPVVLVDAKLGTLEQAGVIGLALSGVDLGVVPMAGDLRAYVKTGHAEVKPLKPIGRPRPLARTGKPR